MFDFPLLFILGINLLNPSSFPVFSEVNFIRFRSYLRTMAKLTEEKLWIYAISGSPIVQALALTLLDSKLEGAISRIAKRIKRLQDYDPW